METVSKYLCTIKLIDDTLYPGSGKSAPESLSTTIFAKTSAELPQASKIGSVLRIHRAQTKAHNGDFQLNCDVNIKAAWVLFDPTEGTTPIFHTGRHYTFMTKDYQRLKDIREFGRGFFSKHEIPCVSLKEAEKTTEDFDTLCLVLEKKKKGDGERIRICDNGKVVKLSLAYNRNPYINPQDIIRIRSACYLDKKDFKTLALSEYSNLLRIPKEYVSAQNLLDAIEKQRVEDCVKAQLALYTPQIGASLTMGEVKDTHHGKKVVQLKELFSTGMAKGSHKLFKVRVSIIEIGPKDIHGWLYAANTKTHEQYVFYFHIVGSSWKMCSLLGSLNYPKIWNITTRCSSL